MTTIKDILIKLGVNTKKMEADFKRASKLMKAQVAQFKKDGRKMGEG